MGYFPNPLHMDTSLDSLREDFQQLYDRVDKLSASLEKLEEKVEREKQELKTSLAVEKDQIDKLFRDNIRDFKILKSLMTHTHDQHGRPSIPIEEVQYVNLQ